MSFYWDQNKSMPLQYGVMSRDLSVLGFDDGAMVYPSRGNGYVVARVG